MVTGLHLYPLKGAAGIPLEEAELDDFGIRHDRRWMLVGDDGVFLSQRSHPRLALLRPSVEDGALAVEAPGGERIRLPLDPDPRGGLSARIWGDTVDAVTVSTEADAWFSDALGATARLVFMPERAGRIVPPAFRDPLRSANGGEKVSFADAFPFLLLSEESLAELNRRLGPRGPLPMNRFRPNIVVRGAATPHAEDGWRRLRIGAVEFHVAKPCARCAVTTVDQRTGIRGKEPLATLATYRRGEDGGVLFGQNLIHHARGTLRRGDRVRVLEAGRPSPEIERTETNAGNHRYQ